MPFYKITLISLSLIIISLISISTIFSETKLRANKITEYKVNVIRQIEHKGQRKFTQGLEIYQGYLYESTGLTTGTALKKIDLKTGDIIMEKKLEEFFPHSIMYFGEGITIWNGKIIQLTWKRKKAYVYSLHFTKEEREFEYQTEGWGLTHNDDQLIMSDGSQYLYFRNPETFELVRKLKAGIRRMNELEYVDGIIYANIWKKNYIIMIDELTGNIVGKINAAKLLCCKLSHRNTNSVLNGIAYNPLSNTFYITGKNCPLIYEVTFEPVNSSSQ